MKLKNSIFCFLCAFLVSGFAVLPPIFTVAFTWGFTLTSAHAAGSESIAAVVNGAAITRSDLNARIDLIALSTGLPPSAELKTKLAPQVLDMLIDEQIKSQEAAKYKIKVEDKEIENGFAMIAQQNNIPVATFKQGLAQRGINIATMKNQISAQIGWGKLIQKKIRPRIEVSEADIDSELGIMKLNLGHDQYKIAQIFLPPMTIGKKNGEGAQNQGQIRALADKLSSQLQQTPDAFPKVARQFSQSAGAEQGGLVGWVYEGDIPTELNAALTKMGVKSVSAPIETQGGYYILYLIDKRQITDESLPKREEVTQRIGTQRLDRAQRKYMQDLMAQSFIEKRL